LNLVQYFSNFDAEGRVKHGGNPAMLIDFTDALVLLTEISFYCATICGLFGAAAEIVGGVFDLVCLLKEPNKKQKAERRRSKENKKEEKMMIKKEQKRLEDILQQDEKEMKSKGKDLSKKNNNNNNKGRNKKGLTQCETGNEESHEQEQEELEELLMPRVTNREIINSMLAQKKK
jgi:hypothetical protein